MADIATDNLTLIKEMYDAFARGDVPAALAAFDPQIEWNEAENFIYADGNPYIGPDAVLAGVFARIGEEWEYWNLVDMDMHEMRDNMVLATGRYQGKYKQNGALMDAQFAHIWTLKNGKVAKFQQYADTKQVAEVVAS